MAKGKGYSGYKRDLCSYPQKGSSKSYDATDHGLAHNYMFGQDNPIGGGPGDTPKRQSGRQPGKVVSPSESDSGGPTISAAKDAYIGSHTPGNGTVPGPDRMGSSTSD